MIVTLVIVVISVCLWSKYIKAIHGIAFFKKQYIYICKCIKEREVLYSVGLYSISGFRNDVVE